MIVIIDYDAGNLRSVQRACEKVGIMSEVSSDPERVLSAEKIIFPGVGSAESAVETLKKRGLDNAIVDFFQAGKPILGICLGLQILLDHTEEGNKKCLGMVSGACERFKFSDRSLKIPHIGWNDIQINFKHPVIEKIKDGDQFYFVHSYYAKLIHEEEIVSYTEYGNMKFCSVLAKDNLFATQFHLEKSGELGLKILKSFGDWNP
ncbi:MAG: imidazole glycerol phosphate synthase subunit HisH [Gammaproteobacteria bacterium]|nr:imidazole glycerol phosphate synthase subunit HisH [Gammaproteobacteria bacterium]